MRVLLVDDEADFATTLCHRLSLRGMGTDVVFNGQQALEYVEKRAPDVIVLDLNMPGLNGMDVLRELRKNNPDIRVVILSGHGTEHHEQEARRLNACDYLRKPTDLNTLVNCIQRERPKQRR